ncbi:MAG TPA: hypothetical protein VNZ26_23160, partial [Vicinamibacterales bacterium]|nr:hypothetical protein [Vicinamibacterales bacterium]
TSFQLGRWAWVADYYDRSGGQVSTTDLVTQRVSGAATSAGNDASEWQYDTKASLSWYRPDWFHGNHELKAGFEFWTPVINRAWVPRAAGEYQLIYRSGVPFEINTYNSPVDPRTAARHTHEYLQDTWTIARRLTLNLGARVAHDEGYVPPQCRPAGPFAAAGCIDRILFPTWNTVSPRLYASYDIAGNGKAVIKGGWGRFYHIREIEELLPANPYIATSSTYLWHDLNGDRLYEPGEVNLDANGPDFVNSTVKDDGVVWGTVPNPNEKQPRVDQFSLSFERELMPNFALRLTGVYSVATNVERRLNLLRPVSAYNIPITNPDPGPDGKVGTADDPGTSVTYYDFPLALAGAKNQQFILTDDPGAAQRPKTIEIAANKRLSNGWQLAASYSATRNNNPLYNANTFGAPLDFNPNVDINDADHTWEWLGRVSGSYLFPARILMSGNYDNRSGTPFARQVLFTGGQAIPSIVLNVEPFGTRRYPSINELDLRIERAFDVGRGQRVTGRINLFNVLNHGTVTNQIIQSGASFLKPTAITLPRILEFSASYLF